MFGSELRTYGLSAVVSVLRGTGIAWASITSWTAPVEGPWPRQRFLRRSRMHSILHPQILMPRERVQFSMFSGFQIISRPTNAPTQPLQKCALRITHAENTSRVDSGHAELAAPQSPPLTRPGRTLGDARKDLAGATFQLGATPDPEASIAEMRRFREEVLSRLWPHRALCVGTGRARLSRRPVARFCPIGSIPRLTPWQWSWHRAMLQRAAPAVP